MQIFDECRDGLILCKLINDSVPDTIDMRVLNKPTAKKAALNAFQMTENNNIVITSAKGIGCSVVNIGSTDLAEGREHVGPEAVCVGQLGRGLVEAAVDAAAHVSRVQG